MSAADDNGKSSREELVCFAIVMPNIHGEARRVLLICNGQVLQDPCHCAIMSAQVQASLYG